MFEHFYIALIFLSNEPVTMTKQWVSPMRFLWLRSHEKWKQSPLRVVEGHQKVLNLDDLLLALPPSKKITNTLLHVP